jgi:alpha-tubulin suppressor-like RCC1 family protein
VQPNQATTLDLTISCPPPPGTARVSAGDGFACGIAEQGTFCWGDNTHGQLGNGTTTSTTLPAVVANAFMSLSVGARHACGVEVTGTVRCWGDGTQGQLGDGAGVSRTLPSVGPGGPYLMTTAGGAHSCALASDGRVFCWGANTRGQLGNGTTATALSPVAVSTSARFATIAAGRDHTCALDLAGAAWCWGANTQGQLGDGTTIDRVTPVAVAGGHLYIALAGGGDAHSCGTSPGGIVRCWGDNALGQLGNGSTTASTAPVTVVTTLPFSNVTLGRQHTCAIATDSAAHCWGDGAQGQIGDGFTIARVSPTVVQANARFNSLSAGNGTSCGVTFGAVTVEDNTIVFSRRSLLCWGSNATGQYGRGSTISATTPTASATGLTFP